MTPPTTLCELLDQLPPVPLRRRAARFVLRLLGLVSLSGLFWFPFVAPAYFPVFHAHPWLGIFTGAAWVIGWFLTVLARVALMGFEEGLISARVIEVPSSTLTEWADDPRAPSMVARALRYEVDLRADVAEAAQTTTRAM